MLYKKEVGALDESIWQRSASNDADFVADDSKARIEAVMDGSVTELASDSLLKASVAELSEEKPGSREELERWMRRSRSEHDSKNRVELRKKLVRFAKSDANAVFDDPEDGVAVGFLTMADEISRMIGSTEFPPDALRRINFSLRWMLFENLRKMRVVGDAEKMLGMIESGLSDEEGLAALLNVKPEEYSKLEHRDKLMIRDALSVYMTDFWRKYGQLLSDHPTVDENKIAG